MKVEVYIQGERLDLYDDESISVTQVTQDLKDISKLFTDYSQTFTIPASRKNNTILKNWFNADIDNGFDARTRVKAIIRLNTLDFKIGKIRLDGSKIEDNKPKNYKLTFFGNSIKIKDLIGEDEISDLEWLSNFDHAYDGDIVKNGLVDGLNFTVDGVVYNSAIIYPFISYKRQWLYNSDNTDVTNTEKLVNIAYNNNDIGVISGNLKPAIKLSLIIKAIEVKYGFNFNSPFFNLPIFNEIYINLNNTAESLSNGFIEVENVTGTYNSSLEYFRYSISVIPAAGFENTPYKIRLTMNGQAYYESTSFLQGNKQKDTGFQNLSTDDYNVKAEVITEQNFEFDANTELESFNLPADTVFTNSYTNQVITLNTIIKNEIPEIKVYDFLTNMFKTFNLIATSIQEDIYVQDLQSWYAEGQIYDVTKFINFKNEKISRGKIYKEINYKFEESEQILAEEYSLSNNQTYGNLEFKLTDVTGESIQDIDGEVLDIESIFENPIFERLFDLDDNQESTIQYCPYFNREINPISGGVFMFYAKRTSINANPVSFINDGVEEELNTFINMPSHSYLIDQSSFNLNFNSEVNEYTSNVMPETIFNTFWQDYITDMFSIKRRIYEIDAIFPDYFLNQLKLNDRLIIKNKRYIINSITSDLVDRKDSLELINDIYSAPLKSDTLNTSLLFKSYGTMSINYDLYAANAETYSLIYVGEDDKKISEIDTGYGVSFINVITKTSSGDVTVVEFQLTLNDTGSERQVGIKILDGVNNPVFYINQNKQ